MTKYTELMYLNAGQFAAEGLRYLAETNATLAPYEKWATIGGGIGLQMIGLFVKMPKMLRELSIVAGSNLLAGGVVKWVKEGTTPAVRAATLRAVASNQAPLGTRVPAVGKAFTGGNGRSFSGRVTATNIPTEYARAGILAGAQAFEAPEHADLIRVD